MSALQDGSDRALQALYESAYPRLVSVVGAVLRDRDEAEEAVQEAFVRLIGRWATVSKYEEPEAWLRKVALGVASNRRRKARNALLAWRRHGPPMAMPAPTGDSVDVRRALARLPRAQREALVLQQLGLDVEAISREVGAPVGTVKSRLARGRAALLPLLREDVNDCV